MFGELNAQIREEVLTLLFHAQLAARGGPGAPARRRRRRAVGNGGLSYEHESEAGAARDRRRARRRERRVGEHALSGRSSASPASTRRSAGTTLLVRLGQEVQEVPRRLSAPDPPLADDAIRLEPLDERYVSGLRAAARGSRTSSGTRASRPSRRPGSPRTGSAATSEGWARRHARRVRDALARTAEFLGIRRARRSRRSTPARARSATSSRERRAAAASPAGPAARHRLGARRARPRSGSSCTSTPRTRRRSASPSAAATCARASSGRCTSRSDLRGDMADLLAAPGRPALAPAYRPHPHPGWGLTPCPCGASATRCPERDASVPKPRRLRACETSVARLGSSHGRDHRSAARPAARGDRDPARLGP